MILRNHKPFLLYDDKTGLYTLIEEEKSNLGIKNLILYQTLNFILIL
jgi:hypothetical protein